MNFNLILLKMILQDSKVQNLNLQLLFIQIKISQRNQNLFYYLKILKKKLKKNMKILKKIIKITVEILRIL